MGSASRQKRIKLKQRVLAACKKAAVNSRWNKGNDRTSTVICKNTLVVIHTIPYTKNAL